MREIRPVEEKTKAAMHSVEAEQQLLGAVLTNNARFHDAARIIREDHFYDPVHARIWAHIRNRVNSDTVASPITLHADMGSDSGLAEIGGGRYLARLAGGSVGASNFMDYAKLVLEMSNRRRLMETMQGATERLEDGRDASEAALALEEGIFALSEALGEPRSMSLIAAHTKAIRQMNEIYEGGTSAVPTGLADLDDKLILAPKRYTVLAGATSMGKTAMGIWIAHAAAKAGYGVGFVSLEMPEEDLAKRLNAIEAQVPYKAYDRPMSEALFRKTAEAAQAQASLPIEIFNTRADDIPSILSEGKRLQAKWAPRGDFKGLKLLVIDYIQLVRGKGESAFVRLSQVANDFKAVAKQLDVHVLALAQIDRKIGERDDPRPRLSDLRGSGDLENAPDNVAFIHRPEYFLARKTPPTKEAERADHEAELHRWKGKAEIVIAKARMGEITSVTVGCDMATNRFWDAGQMEIEF